MLQSHLTTHCVGSSNAVSTFLDVDTAEDVKRKIKKAFCPPEVVEKNPIMDYAKHIVFGYFGKMTVPSEAVSGLCEVVAV
jgi:tyrosyl-tRNA synthetase